MEPAQPPAAAASSSEGDLTLSTLSHSALRTEDEIHAACEGPYASLDSYRIRWPVFGELSEIMVLDDPTDASSPARPFVTADGLHPIAAAPVSHPPFSATKISIFELEGHEQYSEETCHCWDEMDEDEDDDDEDTPCPDHYHAPEPILVTNPEGGAVTIGDVIFAAGPYFKAHKETIVESMSRGIPADLPPGGIKYTPGGAEIAADVGLSPGQSKLPPHAKFYAGVGLFHSMFLFCDLGPERAEREWRRRAESVRRIKEWGYPDS